MSDKDLRELEKRWRETGDTEDGENWIRELSRTIPPDPLRVVSMLIQMDRAWEAMCDIGDGWTSTAHDRAHRVRTAIKRPVTPDNMANWLKGVDEKPDEPE